MKLTNYHTNRAVNIIVFIYTYKKKSGSMENKGMKKEGKSKKDRRRRESMEIMEEMGTPGKDKENRMERRAKQNSLQ